MWLTKFSSFGDSVHNENNVYAFLDDLPPSTKHYLKTAAHIISD